MFNKLNKRIFRSIFWIAFVFVAVMSLVSAYVIISSFYSTYCSMLGSNVKQAALDCENYFQSVSNFAKSTAQRTETVEALTEGKTENVSRLLNTLSNSSTEITGAILYGVDGRVFYSAGVGDVPTLSEVLQDTQLQEFFRGEGASCVSIRNSAMPKVYNTYPYDPANGIVSIVYKVYSEEVVVGYLFADILPSQLFANKLTIGYDNADVTLHSGEVIISSQAEGVYYEPAELGVVLTKDLGHFVVTTQFNGSDRLIVSVSNTEFWQRCTIVIVVLLLADIICVFVVWVVARRIASRVTTPLNQLHARMQNENLL